MSMKRFARLSNGFSKQLENHAAMVAIYFTYYNSGFGLNRSPVNR
jgi:hypothetical protein